jgi:hypothetical protein
MLENAKLAGLVAFAAGVAMRGSPSNRRIVA